MFVFLNYFKKQNYLKTYNSSFPGAGFVDLNQKNYLNIISLSSLFLRKIYLSSILRSSWVEGTIVSGRIDAEIPKLRG
jgi:hypothetical protein